MSQKRLSLSGRFLLFMSALGFLAACGATVPQTPQLKTEPVADVKPKAPASQVSETESLRNEIDEALAAYDLARNADNASVDEIGSIIWDLEQADNQTLVQKPAVIPTFEELIPEGKDPSLEAEALDAAFAMLRAPKALDAPLRMAPFTYPEKAAGTKRIGVFVPRSGPRAIYGDQVVDGIEMAFFQINDPTSQLLFFDSADEAMMGTLAQEAIAADIDIAIGPLFSTNAVAAYPYFAAESIPVLSLSNNEAIARSGLWVLGLLPAQQIDTLLAESILNGHERIAILSDYSDYGRALSSHVIGRLDAFGITPSAVMSVDGTVGADDETLTASLKQFARYKPLEDDELIQDVPAPYDSVILAGGADFILKVAPLLSYYDLGPDRVAYLGTDLWVSAGILGEPSLQGAYVATLDPALRAAFDVRYNQLYAASNPQTAAPHLSQLGFDAMAIAASATAAFDQEESEQDLNLTSGVTSGLTSDSERPALMRDRLVSEAGFKGYTGAFRLAVDGRNNRTYQIFQIENGDLIKAAMKPKETAKYN